MSFQTRIIKRFDLPDSQSALDLPNMTTEEWPTGMGAHCQYLPSTTQLGNKTFAQLASDQELLPVLTNPADEFSFV